MSMQPEGEDMRRAVKWISEQRRDDPKIQLQKLIEQACLKFNLSPMDAIFLEKLVRQG